MLNDDDMVLHYYWKNGAEIIAFENKPHGGAGFYLMKDKTQENAHFWPQLSNDGHPSYCPTDNSLVVFDTYLRRSRIQKMKFGQDDDTKRYE